MDRVLAILDVLEVRSKLTVLSILSANIPTKTLVLVIISTVVSTES